MMLPLLSNGLSEVGWDHYTTYTDSLIWLRRVMHLLSFLLFFVLPSSAASPEPEVVSFRSGEITLQGALYKPEGKGPFPAVVYKHGSGGCLGSFARHG